MTRGSVWDGDEGKQRWESEIKKRNGERIETKDKESMGLRDGQFVNQSMRYDHIYLLAQRNRICLNLHLTQSPEERKRRQALTHFISQQRVGGLSVSLISAAGAANSHSASGKNLKGRRGWWWWCEGGDDSLFTTTVCK